jgi:hypothetical protein
MGDLKINLSKFHHPVILIYLLFKTINDYPQSGIKGFNEFAPLSRGGAKAIA